MTQQGKGTDDHLLPLDDWICLFICKSVTPSLWRRKEVFWQTFFRESGLVGWWSQSWLSWMSPPSPNNQFRWFWGSKYSTVDPKKGKVKKGFHKKWPKNLSRFEGRSVDGRGSLQTRYDEFEWLRKSRAEKRIDEWVVTSDDLSLCKSKSFKRREILLSLNLEIET